jgi:tetratricopeptide (TPR) repeat protein
VRGPGEADEAGASAGAPPESPTRTAAGDRRLLPGALLAGRYRIVQLVGVGGMGMVYRAEDEQLGLAVAVKVLRPELAESRDLLERFKRELVLARQVSHPNVVRIHDIGHDLGSHGDLVFLTMDYVAGRSLRDLLAEEGRLDPQRAAGIARQLAAGLAAAHGAGVVHRDLKPGNVLLDAAGRAAITDFGVARSLAAAGPTLPGMVLGTLDYLSPEQARGEAVDGRTDLYALGIVLYEMLTGRMPFAGGTAAETLAQRLTGVPRDLRFGAAEVPPWLARIVRRLLEREPARRYASARELAADLGRGRGPHLSLRPKTWRLAAAAAGVAGLLTLGWTAHERAGLARRGPAAPVASVAAGPRHAVAILPLADETGQRELAWVASGLPEMLASSLAESSRLRVLDSQRVSRTAADLKLPPGPLAEAEARRVAQLLDADRLVAGRVRAAGGRLRVDLSLVAADLHGLPATPLHAEAPAGEAFRLIDQLGATLRERLEVPPAAAPPAPSRSPAALAAYAQGAASLARGDALAAVPALERAVAADPRFTAAWVRLARAREALGRHEPAEEAARRAVATLPPGESRAADEAQAVEARLLGRPQRAQEILSRVVARHPDDVEARLELAEAYGEQGSLDRAVAALEPAMRLAPHDPRGWLLLGRYSILAGNARRAVDEYLVRALVAQNELGSDEGRADVWNAFGVAYNDLGETARAVENYERAAALRRRIGDERGYATTLRNLANIHTVRGEHEAAAKQLAQALAILERLGDQAGIADLYNDLGVLAEEQGGYERALAQYRRALAIRRDLGNDLALAQSYSNVGYACYLLGRFDDATAYGRQQLELAKRSGDATGVVLATQSLGVLALAQGDWDAAARDLLAALRTSRDLGMKAATASSLGHLGRLAAYQGRFGAALASYAEALAVLRELGDRRGLAEFTLAQAAAEIELGMADAAGERLRAAAELLAGERSREQQAELARLQGEWHRLRGERAAARAALGRALAEAKASQAAVELLAVRLSAAEAGLAGGESSPSRELERLAEEAAALGHAELRLRAAEALAFTALAAGDAPRAARAARSGLATASACGGWAGAYRLHQLLARALERGGGLPGSPATPAAEAAAERAQAAAEIARVGRDLKPAERRSFERTASAEEGAASGRSRAGAA